MYPQLRFGLIGAALCVFAASCGAAHSPTPPTPVPPLPNLAGVYLGEQTLTSAEGADCLQPIFDDLIGFPMQFHATITQDADQVSATMDVDHTGAECTYVGTIQPDHVTLNSTSCTEPKTIALTCTSGDRRDLRPQSLSLILALNAAPLRGVVVEDDRVLESGTARSVNTLSALGNVTLIRQ
jgi:hypothetical protein